MHDVSPLACPERSEVGPRLGQAEVVVGAVTQLIGVMVVVPTMQRSPCVSIGKGVLSPERCLDPQSLLWRRAECFAVVEWNFPART